VEGGFWNECVWGVGVCVNASGPWVGFGSKKLRPVASTGGSIQPGTRRDSGGETNWVRGTTKTPSGRSQTEGYSILVCVAHANWLPTAVVRGGRGPEGAWLGKGCKKGGGEQGGLRLLTQNECG